MSTRYIRRVREQQPLVHSITNMVVANFQANGLLALGASPIMADAVEEAEEIARISSVSVLNIGTLKKSTVEAMLLAGKSAIAQGNPVVLDPVGAGATQFRKETIQTLLKELPITVIRCNAGELAAIANVPWNAKGVDAGSGSANVAELARKVATAHQTIVAVSGEVDLVTDGITTQKLVGGHEQMSTITGMGCLLSAVVGAFLAASPDEPFEATAAALAFYKKAGELAAAKAEGIGHFPAHFLTALQQMKGGDET